MDIAESEGRADLFDFNKEIIFSNWAIVYVQKDSKIQSILNLKGKKIKSQLRPTNLNDEILQVQTLLERTIPKMLDIEFDLAKDLKIIHADSGQIEQIILNLALNA